MKKGKKKTCYQGKVRLLHRAIYKVVDTPPPSLYILLVIFTLLPRAHESVEEAHDGSCVHDSLLLLRREMSG